MSPKRKVGRPSSGLSKGKPVPVRLDVHRLAALDRIVLATGTKTRSGAIRHLIDLAEKAALRVSPKPAKPAPPQEEREDELET